MIATLSLGRVGCHSFRTRLSKSLKEIEVVLPAGFPSHALVKVQLSFDRNKVRTACTHYRTVGRVHDGINFRHCHIPLEVVKSPWSDPALKRPPC